MSEVQTDRSRQPRQEEVKTQRRRRQDSGETGNLKLHVSEDVKDKNFEYRWANKRDGRVQQLHAQDWDVVQQDEIPNKSIGTTVERTGNSRDGEAMILMKKPKEFVEEDRAKAAKRIDATEEAMRRAAPASAEGLSGPSAYVPGGKNVVNGR